MDILSPHPFLNQIWNIFWKMGFLIFSDFRIFYAIFLYCSEGPKWANMIFFKWNLEWPSDVQIMYTKLSQGQFICVLSISKLRITISHDLAKISRYIQHIYSFHQRLGDFAPNLACYLIYIWRKKLSYSPGIANNLPKARSQQPVVVDMREIVRSKALMFLSKIPISLKWFT